jgi:hypothetical protein
MRSMTLRSLARAAAGAAIILSMSVASVAAHGQTVDPNGNGEGFTKPISNPWAMAHCQAASPLHVHETSGGVVAFNPAIAFDNCVPGTRGD